MEPVEQQVSAPEQPIDLDQAAPSPLLFFDTIRAFQRTAALKAALDLDVFTAVAEGADTVDAVAARCDASPRGIRIVCDYLAILGFMTKEDDRYTLTHESFVFLNKRSPAYVGSAANFLASPETLDTLRDFTAVVREGRSHLPTLEPNNPMWVNFARSMAPLMAVPAELLAELLHVAAAGPIRVLDIAAGHGLFGIAVARQNASARIVAVDWEPVLELARSNAAQAGVGGRYRTVAGDAMKVDLGKDYDLALVTNFVHHFDAATSVAFLKRLHGALREGGRFAALDFVADEDRRGPAPAVAFTVTMLAVTPAGDAYTLGQWRRMLEEAGFHDVQLHGLPPGVQQVITAVK